MSEITYVVIHGNYTSGMDPAEYVAEIVYGVPVVRAVVVENQHVRRFVALCEFENATNAKYTFERMGSFPYGATLTLDKAVAIREFGAWIYQYTPELEMAQSL
jgi:hypothetical protein